MKLILLAFFLVCISQITIAQNHKIDSINNLITKAKTDTGRINLLNDKATAYGEISLDSAINIALENISQSKKINYLKGEADANRVAGINRTLKGNFVAAKLNFTTAENLYNQTNDSVGISKLNRCYGIYYGSQSRYDSAIFFFKKNAAYLEKTGNIRDLSSAYQNIAVSYTMLNDYQQTLLYQSKALQLAEKINDINNMAYINLNMGIGYSNITDYKKSEALFKKAIDYAKQAGIKNVELYGYSNLASTLNITKQYQESYKYAIKAATLGKDLGDQGIMASSLGRAGVALAAIKQYDRAEKLIDSAIAIADSVGTPLNIYQTHTNMGFLKKEQGKYKEAINYYEKGFAVLKASDIYDVQTGNDYEGLAECYEKAGLYQKALTTFKLSTRILDSVRSNENVRRATEQSLNYDFTKKEEVQKAEKEKQDRESEIKLIFLIAFLLVFITLSAVALFAYKREQKAKVLVNSQKIELETMLEKLKSTQAQLVQSEKMASLGELTAGIAHEIQNPLNFVNNFSEVNKEMLEELQAERLKPKTERDDLLEDELINDVIGNEEKISHHGKRADAIIKGMLQHSRQTKSTKEPTDINALCDEYLRLSYHGLRAKDKSFNADFTTDFDKSIGKINIVPQDMGRVLLNLMNNAFYAVNEKMKTADENYQPLITVATKRSLSTRGEGWGEVEIMVKDNGRGIPQHIIDKIFQPFFTTKPTGEGTGLGLSMSYDIITKEHGGTIKAESKEGEGTTFIILLPL